MRLRAPAAFVAALVVATSAGCGASRGRDSGGQDSPATTSTTVPAVENFTQPAAVEIEVTGFRTISYSDATTINVLRAASADKKRLITLGPYGAVAADGWTINEAFLSIVEFVGNGRYTIKAPPKGEGTPAMRDYVYVVVSRPVPGGTPTDASRFDITGEDCKVELRRDGIEGSVRCGGLADDRGNVISFSMTWKANGEPFDLIADARSKTATTTSTTIPAA